MLTALAVATAPRGQHRRLWLGFLAAMAIGVARCDVAWNVAGDARSAAETLVFWNVGHDLVEDVAVVDGFLRTSPLVVGLVETGPLPPEWFDAWRRRWPDYQFVALHPGCLLAARGTTSNFGYRSLGRNSHAMWCDIERPGLPPVRAVVIDLAALPWRPRKEPLAKLEDLLKSWGMPTTVIMGDFNTPDDSVWFADLRRDFHEAFRTGGQGYVPTWPWPAPVLMLDHIWVPRAVRVRRAWRTVSWRSDHVAAWAEVELLDDAPSKRR
jgi:hypothetical protein